MTIQLTSSSFEDELALSKKETNVKPVEESVLPKKADARGIHRLRETYRRPVHQHAGDLNLDIEKIRELISRSCSAEQIGPPSQELKSNLGRKHARKHTIIGTGIDNGIATEISRTVEERHA